MKRILDETDIRQTTGGDENAVMSQKATSAKIGATEKRLSNLELAITPSPFIADDTVACSKAVPENALPYAKLCEIGGMCAVKDGATVTAPVTEVKSVGKNLVDMEYFGNPDNWSFENANNKYYSMYVGVLPAGTYKLTAEVTAETAISNIFLYVMIQKGDGSWTTDNVAKFYQGAYCTDDVRTLTLDKPTPIKLWTWDSTYINLQTHLQRFLKIQIERGSVETEYEPYKSVSFPIPAAVRNLEGYGLGAGAVSNTVDFDSGKYTRRVGAVDLGSLDWHYGIYDGKMTFSCYDLTDIKSNTRNTVCSIPFTSYVDIWVNGNENAFFVNNTHLRGVFAQYTDDKSFEAAMSGVMLYYELAEPIIEDITDKLPLDNYIEVFENGTVFMENENSIDVPNTITYQKKEETDA